MSIYYSNLLPAFRLTGNDFSVNMWGLCIKVRDSNVCHQYPFHLYDFFFPSAKKAFPSFGNLLPSWRYFLLSLAYFVSLSSRSWYLKCSIRCYETSFILSGQVEVGLNCFNFYTSTFFFFFFGYFSWVI